MLGIFALMMRLGIKYYVEDKDFVFLSITEAALPSSSARLLLLPKISVLRRHFVEAGLSLVL